MKPTREQVDRAIDWVKSSPDTDSPAWVLFDAYQLELDQCNGAFDAATFWHKRADLFERQYNELFTHDRTRFYQLTESECDMLARHEAERKALKGNP